MILSVRQMAYEELKGKLDPQERIVVLSCNNCAKKCNGLGGRVGLRSEEHTSELQPHSDLACRLLPETKNNA